MTTPRPQEELSSDEAVLIAMRLLRESKPSPAALTEIERIEREIAAYQADPQARRPRHRRHRRRTKGLARA